MPSFSTNTELDRGTWLRFLPLTLLNSKKDCHHVLLSFSTCEGEANIKAEEHLIYTDYVLAGFKESWDNIVPIVSDDCCVNVSLA